MAGVQAWQLLLLLLWGCTGCLLWGAQLALPMMEKERPCFGWIGPRGTGSQDISVVLSQAEDQASGEQTLGAMESRKREDVGLHPAKSSVLGVAPGTLPITASVNLRPVLTRKDREP